MPKIPLLSGLLAAVALMPNVQAQTASNNTVQACVAKDGNGLARIVPVGSTCRSSEAVQTWNIVGPQGLQGLQGAPGLIGPAGAPGPAGPAGSAGATGPTGAMGPVGSVGATGATGSAGLTGPAGPMGNIGPAGAIGPAGPTGLVGPSGPVGPAGVAGPVGPQGPAGVGIQGPAGPAGPTGPAGATGPMGPAGPSGTAGLFGTETSNAAAGRSECVMGTVALTAGAVAMHTPARGQILSISSNTALFSLLGTLYGGNGSTTFALPDLRAAAPNGLSYWICTTGIYPSRL